MSAISPLASDSRTDGTLSAITQSPIVGWTKARLRAVPTIYQNHWAEWWARGACHHCASAIALVDRARIRATRWLCAEYERQLGGESPLSSLMTAKD
jgi:hypothetical protein